MRFEMTIQCETEDVEMAHTLEGKEFVLSSQTMEDAIKIVETTFPYIFDNVVVTSKVVDES